MLYKQEGSWNYWGKMQFSEGKENQEQNEKGMVKNLVLNQPYAKKFIAALVPDKTKPCGGRSMTMTAFHLVCHITDRK